MPDCGRWAPDRLLSSLAMWLQWAGELFFHSTSLPCHTERKRVADVWETVQLVKEVDFLVKSAESVEWRGCTRKFNSYSSVGHKPNTQRHSKPLVWGYCVGARKYSIWKVGHIDSVLVSFDHAMFSLVGPSFVCAMQHPKHTHTHALSKLGSNHQP